MRRLMWRKRDGGKLSDVFVAGRGKILPKMETYPEQFLFILYSALFLPVFCFKLHAPPASLKPPNSFWLCAAHSEITFSGLNLILDPNYSWLVRQFGRRRQRFFQSDKSVSSLFIVSIVGSICCERPKCSGKQINHIGGTFCAVDSVSCLKLFWAVITLRPLWYQIFLLIWCSVASAERFSFTLGSSSRNAFPGLIQGNLMF